MRMDSDADDLILHYLVTLRVYKKNRVKSDQKILNLTLFYLPNKEIERRKLEN